MADPRKFFTIGLSAVLVMCGENRSPTEPSIDDLSIASRRRPSTPPPEVTPPCAAPAELTRSSNPSRGYLFVYSDGVDARSTTTQLVDRYGLAVIHLFVGAPFQGFEA